MITFFRLQQCPACIVRLTLIVLETGSKWPYNCCFVWCCFQDLFNIAHNILVHFPSSLFSIRFVSVHEVHPYSSIDTAAVWKKFRFNLVDRSGFHMIDGLSIVVHDFVKCILTSLSVKEMLLPKYVKLSSNIREMPFSVDMSLSWLKRMYSVLSAFTWKPRPPAACFRLFSWDSAWVGVFARSTVRNYYGYATVIVSAESRLLLAFFSFIRAIDILRT